MAIRTFSVTNYKAFVETAEIKVRPLTLLFGYNSAGKSALARWLPLLSQSMNGSPQSPLNMTAEAARGASFSGVLSKYSERPSVDFSLSTIMGSISYTIRDIPELKQQIVERFVLKVGDEGLTEIEWSPNDSFSEYLVSTQGDEPREVDLEFAGLIPRFLAEDDQEAPSISYWSSTILQECLGSVYWLQAVRCVPSRREVYRGTRSHIAPDGDGVSERIYGASLGGSDILSKMSDWYHSATGYELTVERGAFKSDEIYSFCLKTEMLSQPIEIADTGEGLGQVFPIVGLLFLAQDELLGQNPILVFEQPELHLHQAVEPALAELMCEVAASGSAQIIAETHSESLLLAVQLALIEKRLKSSDVAVYWIRQHAGGPAHVSEISFDEMGRPNGGDWPPGVFSHNAEKARTIVRAQLASERNAG